MSGTVGKITGQMLESDLLREGEDLTFDTDLISLYVNSRRVGINDNPLTPATRTLTVTSDVNTTNAEVVTQSTIANSIFTTDTITNNSDNIYLSASGINPTIVAGKIYTADLSFDNNNIISRTLNSDINLNPNGTGITNFLSSVEINANLHATGNITFDGNITIGDNDLDSLILNADVSSDINPNISDTYSLGSNTKKFNAIYTNLVNGETYTTGGSFAGGVDLSLRAGNTWYVATNGSYNNVGDHPNGPFDTIEKALSVATAGDTIIVYPGTYYELLPLVVPAGVTIRGKGIRSVKIVPDTASTHEDVFLLNGECTIEDLTVADYFYDSINDKGYAFKFAPNFKVTTRSAYLRNISIITKGSITSTTDPLGYDQGDAGRGALIDGSVADSTSREASLLFHSVTFITPGAKCLILTNGVRVEWLNSFIYYASEGLVAETGATGFASDGKTRLKIYGISAQTVNPGDTVSVENVSLANSYTTATIESVTYDGAYTNVIIDGLVTGWEESASPPDTSNQQQINFSGGQTASHLEWVDYSDFGGEIRSIGSANVYGNIGAKVDGPGNLMYLIGHNFGYIGAGKDTSNDPSTVNQPNEIIRLNGGQIYYQSMDHIGNFRVGDIFLVESATGKITFQSEFIGSNSLIFTDGGYTTYIDPFEITTGNITISGNTIQSNTGPINLQAINGLITIVSDINASQSVTVNDVTVNENSYIGNSSSDKLTVTSSILSSLVPNNNNFSIGADTRRWKTLYATEATFDNIVINDNVIDATLSNSNLELRANGSGYVRFEQLDFKNNSITTSNSNTDINITATGTGKIKINANADITGDLTTSGNVFVQGNVTLGDNSIIDTINPIGVIASDLIPQSTGTYDIGSTSKTWKAIYLSNFINDDIEINDNYIRTTASNANLELRANGTGSIRIDSIDFKNNLITTNTTNSNLVLQANGSGTIELLSTTSVNADLTISNDMSINSNSQFGNASTDLIQILAKVESNFIPNIDASYNLGSSSNRWNLYTDNFYLDGIEINENYIRVIDSNANLELRASGTGSIRIDSLDFKNNSITANSSNTDINISPTGTGEVKLNSNTNVTGTLTTLDIAYLNSNVLLGNTSSNSVYFNSRFITDIIPTISSVYNLGSNGLRWNNVYASKAIIDDIVIDTNVIESTLSNQNLELRASGTGSIRIDSLDFKNNLISSNTTNTDIEINPNGIGTIQLLKDTVITGNLNVSGNITVGGNVIIGDQTSDSISLFARISSDIIPNLNSVYNIGSDSYRWNNFNISQLFVDDIIIDTNVIQSTLSNQNLELRANGTGSIRIDDLDFKSNAITANSSNTDINITATGTGSIKLNANTDITGNLDASGNLLVQGNIQIGDQTIDTINPIGVIGSNIIPASPGTYDIGSTLKTWRGVYLSELRIDDIEINDNYIRTTVSNSNLELRSSGPAANVLFEDFGVRGNTFRSTTDLQFQTLGTGLVIYQGNIELFQNLTVNGDFTLNGAGNFGTTSSNSIIFTSRSISDVVPSATTSYDLGSTTNTWTVFLDGLVSDSIEFNENYITTNVSNENLELRAHGTGEVRSTANLIVENDFIVNSTTNLQTTNINGNLTVTGPFTVLGNFSSYELTTGDILINDNYITTTLSNSNLEFRADNTGGVILDQTIKVTNSTVENVLTSGTEESRSIIFEPPIGQVVNLSNSTTALKIPVGNNTNRTLTNVGETRINSTSTLFEGRISGTTTSLYALFDTDRNTYITAESSPGVNDNTIRMAINGAVQGTITPGTVTLNQLKVDELTFNSRLVSTTSSNADIELRANGTGVLKFKNGIIVDQSKIENIVSGAATQIISTGPGYVKFAGDQALRIPYGSDVEQPVAPPIAATRWNTDQNYLEVWDGSAWISAAGTNTATVSEAEMNDLTSLYSIIFG